MTTLRVTLVDNQPAVVLTPDLVEILGATEGALIQAVETDAGGLFLKSADPKVAEQRDVTD